MIHVLPKIQIFSPEMNGFITAISATHADVEWADGEPISPIKAISSLSIVLNETQTYKVSVAEVFGNKIRFADTSLATVQDLLHSLRKSQHLNICQNYDVEHTSKNHGFEKVTLPVVTLPEVNWSDVSTETSFMGRSFAAPILITGMTGGLAQGALINERLARAASAVNIPMGVGSQRIALENSAHEKIFKLKDKFPSLFLIGNIGIGQLQSRDYFDLCKRAVDMIDADALAIHANVLQELIQVEGDRNFQGLIDKIIQINSGLGVPVIVKEVGSGLDVHTASKLWAGGVRYFDVGGSGGTSWAHIEGLRSSDAFVARRGEIFRDWGISTADAVIKLHREFPKATIVATGGIRNGLVALKAIFSGATMAGIGLPFMRAAVNGDEDVLNLLETIIDELKIAKIVSGLS